MLKVGTTYDIVTLDLDDDGKYYQEKQRKTVASIDGSLVAFTDGDFQNLASPMFHSAKDFDKVVEAHDRLEKMLSAES